jgi:hypothetical protein
MSGVYRFASDSQVVPSTGTKVGFTATRKNLILSVSSSGGGLFGRPVTRKSSGRFLFGVPFVPLHIFRSTMASALSGEFGSRIPCYSLPAGCGLDPLSLPVRPALDLR